MVTIRDVARELNLNVSTVSRALSGYKGVKASTRERVMKKVDEMGWRPNAAAASVITGRMNCIGVIFPAREKKADQPFFMQILTSINQYAREQGVTVSIVTGHTEAELEAQVKIMHLNKRVDGFIVLYAGKEDSVRAYLAAQKVPYVLVGTPEKGADVISHVDNDNHRLGAAAAEYLIGKGHEKILFVTDTLKGDVFRDRYAGYREAMQEKGLTDELVSYDEADFNTGQATALILIDDLLAVHTEATLITQGKKIPEDVSLVTFNDSAYTTLFHPYLTSFDINVIALGQTSTKQLLELVKNNTDHHQEQLEPVKFDRQLVDFKIVERESVKEI